MYRYIIIDDGCYFGTDEEETADAHFGEGVFVVDRATGKVMGDDMAWEDPRESPFDQEDPEEEEDDEESDD